MIGVMAYVESDENMGEKMNKCEQDFKDPWKVREYDNDPSETPEDKPKGNLACHLFVSHRWAEIRKMRVCYRF